MPYINTCTVMGHLGRDAEVRTTQGGKSVASFSLAVTEKWKDAGGSPNERTHWFRVTKWSPPDWMVQGLTKGSLVYVSGSLVTNKWDDKDGHKRESVEIKADDVLLLASRERSNAPQQAEPDPIPF